MELIEQLETLRINDSDFFGVSAEQRHIYEGKNEMLDDCLEIVWKWFRERDLNI